MREGNKPLDDNIAGGVRLARHYRAPSFSYCGWEHGAHGVGREEGSGVLGMHRQKSGPFHPLRRAAGLGTCLRIPTSSPGLVLAEGLPLPLQAFFFGLGVGWGWGRAQRL